MKFTGLARATDRDSGTVADEASTTAPPPPKVTRAKAAYRRFVSQIPASITEDPRLRAALTALPANYNFEMSKTIWRIRQMRAVTVALQFPEGLLMYACSIADIIEEFARAETIIMGDVTYGACCVDDLSATALDCELLIHYGHSCLAPIDRSERVPITALWVHRPGVSHASVRLSSAQNGMRDAVCFR